MRRCKRLVQSILYKMVAKFAKRILIFGIIFIALSLNANNDAFAIETGQSKVIADLRAACDGRIDDAAIRSGHDGDLVPDQKVDLERLISALRKVCDNALLAEIVGFGLFDEDNSRSDQPSSPEPQGY